MLGGAPRPFALRKAFPKLLGMYAMKRWIAQPRSMQTPKTANGLPKLMSAITISDLPTLEDYKSKIEKSDKYTDDQKWSSVLAAEQRIAELRK